MPRILHVLKTPRAEGTPRLVLDWLADPDHVQGVLFISGDPPELMNDFNRTGSWIRVGSATFGRGLSKFLPIVRLVRRAVIDFQPDLVIAWWGGGAHFVHVGARLAGRGGLLTHAGTAPSRSFYLRYVYSWFCFGLSRLCGHRVVACSEYVRRQYLSIPFFTEEHITVAHNCCRPGHFAPPAEVDRSPVRACMVGSLENSKDYPNLLRAWKTVEANGEYELYIAGDGSKRPEIEALATELNLQRVLFLGATREVPKLMWSCRVFVFSANPEEGFGTVLIEALAAGCQVVSTDVPGCREVLQDGRFGRLVRSRDPDALAAALLDEFARARDQQSIADGQAYAETFTAPVMIGRYLKLAGIAPSEFAPV